MTQKMIYTKVLEKVMEDYKAIERKVNEMIINLKKIADSQIYGYHHSIEYQAREIENANKSIQYFSNLK